MFFRTRVRILIPVVLAGVMLAASHGAAQFLAQGDVSRSSLVERVQTGEIDWGSEFYYANGEGVMPSADEEPNRARAFLKAKGYAKMQAIANLLMAIEGTAISYNATGKDYMLKDVHLRQTIEGHVANVEAVGEKQQSVGGDTLVIVTVRAPLYGPGGVGSAVLKNTLRREPSARAARVDKQLDTKSPTVAAGASGPFTSLIIDCTGLEIRRAMSPKIRRSSGDEVWGSVVVDPNLLQERGIVAYAANLNDAKRNSRAGASPLLVKAVGRAGDKFMCDPVVSDADAERILQENAATHFLDKFDVIFVVDGTP